MADHLMKRLITGLLGIAISLSIAPPAVENAVTQGAGTESGGRRE